MARKERRNSVKILAWHGQEISNTNVLLLTDRFCMSIPNKEILQAISAILGGYSHGGFDSSDPQYKLSGDDGFESL
jgi:hypothetical protein